jgi:hypothetical protein
LKKKKFSVVNSNENQFKCDICGLKTKHKSIIYSHSKRHKSKNSFKKLKIKLLIFQLFSDDMNNNLLECNFNNTTNDINKSNNQPMQSHQMATNQIKNNDLVYNSNYNITQNTEITSAIQHQSYFNPLQNSPQQSPTLQNLYNSLKLQYPLFPPSYIYSLLSLQHPQNSNIVNDSSANYPKSQFDSQKWPQPQQQQTTKNTNMFSIENLFPSKSNVDKPVISNPETIKLNNTPGIPVTTSKCCDHKEELFMLRKNVYTMLYKNLPNVLLAFNLLNDPLSPQIDCILESLLGYNQETRRFENEPKENTVEINKCLNQYSLNRPLFSTT